MAFSKEITIPFEIGEPVSGPSEPACVLFQQDIPLFKAGNPPVYGGGVGGPVEFYRGLYFTIPKELGRLVVIPVSEECRFQEDVPVGTGSFYRPSLWEGLLPDTELPLDGGTDGAEAALSVGQFYRPSLWNGLLPDTELPLDGGTDNVPGAGTFS